MKYSNLFKIILLSVILFINPNFTEARQVTNNIRINVSFNSAQGVEEGFCHSSEARDGKCPINKRVGERVYRSTYNNIGSGSNNPVQETLVANLTKNVDLQKGNSIMSSRFDMRVNETIQLLTSSTTGNWSIQGRSVGANMNGQRYRIYRTGELDLNRTRKTLEGAVSAPRDNNSPRLSSSNNSVINCSGTTCTPRGAGTATITASFSNNSGTVNSRFWYEKATRFMFCGGIGACGQGRGGYFYKVNYFLNSQRDFAANYSFPDITWTVTVGNNSSTGTSIPPQYRNTAQSQNTAQFDTNPLPPSYPEPVIIFNLRKSDGTPSSSLTVDQDDKVKIDWKVTNESGLTGCTVSTSGGSSNIFSGNGFSGEQEKIAPRDPNDLTYTVTLQCTGKTPAQINRGFTQTRTLTVRSYPVLSNCTIGGNRRSVSEANPNIDVNLTVSNTNNYYDWSIKRDNNDDFRDNIRKNNPTNPDTLGLKNMSYTGKPFGRYTPSVRVTNKYNRSRTIVCPTISNLGTSTIREVN
jgi:hypothetical protein